MSRFIVQERFGDGEWLDDPDQPEACTHGLEQAQRWLEDDNKSCSGHDTTYAHRIIERLECAVWPQAEAQSDRVFRVHYSALNSSGQFTIPEMYLPVLMMWLTQHAKEKR